MMIRVSESCALGAYTRELCYSSPTCTCNICPSFLPPSTCTSLYLYHPRGSRSHRTPFPRFAACVAPDIYHLAPSSSADLYEHDIHSPDMEWSPDMAV